MTKKLTSLILSFAICLAICIPAYAITDIIHVSIAPNSEAITRGEPSPLEMDISLSSYSYIDNSSVDTIVDVVWEKDTISWNTTLNGTATIFNEDGQIIIIGSVCGYNQGINIENFIGLDFAYNVTNGNCIANATFDYSEGDQNCQFETFGANTGEFNAAILEYSEQCVAAQVNDDISLPQAVIGNSTNSVDYSTKYIGQSNYRNGCVALNAWANREFLLSGHAYFAASVKGNEQSAETEILKLVPSATYVAARRCEVLFACSNNAKFYNNEMSPKSSKKSFTISLPLPAGQSYAVNIPISSIETGVRNSSKETYWNLFNQSGINSLFNTSSTSGLGFENKLDFNSSIPAGDSATVVLQANANIGYAYMFVDSSTGTFNNSTWYALTSVSGNITCKN